MKTVVVTILVLLGCTVGCEEAGDFGSAAWPVTEIADAIPPQAVPAAIADKDAGGSPKPEKSADCECRDCDCNPCRCKPGLICDGDSCRLSPRIKQTRGDRVIDPVPDPISVESGSCATVGRRREWQHQPGSVASERRGCRSSVRCRSGSAFYRLRYRSRCR